jgi:hypothetical protein
MAELVQGQTASGKQQESNRESGRLGWSCVGRQDFRVVGAMRRSPQLVRVVLPVIKAIHSLIFLSMVGSILYTLYSGLTNRVSRLTKASIALVIGEGLVYLTNDGRCPVTDLTEALGSEHGSVSDIFLPAWLAERIPILCSPLFAIGLAAIGLRRARHRPAVAAISTSVAALFLAGPWLFRPKPRLSVRKEADNGNRNLSNRHQENR